MDYKLHYPTSKSEFVKAEFFAIFQSKNLPDRGKIIVEWQKRSYRHLYRQFKQYWNSLDVLTLFNISITLEAHILSYSKCHNRELINPCNLHN